MPTIFKPRSVGITEFYLYKEGDYCIMPGPSIDLKNASEISVQASQPKEKRKITTEAEAVEELKKGVKVPGKITSEVEELDEDEESEHMKLWGDDLPRDVDPVQEAYTLDNSPVKPR